MIKTIFNQLVKKSNFRLILFVLLGLFTSENGFAEKHWNREYVQVSMNSKSDLIVISIGVYDYSFGPKSEHGYLEQCKFEASVDNRKYFKLMDIHTPQQNKSYKTVIYFKNKLSMALLIFNQDISMQEFGAVWPEHLSSNIKVYTPSTTTFNASTSSELSIVALGWSLLGEFKDVRYIRISGKWQIAGLPAEPFREIIYDLNKPTQNTLKLNTTDTIAKEAKKVNILKDSEAIAIKGADIGSNIMVYSTSGHKVKSVISNNDIIKISLPSNQIYIVHIGKSRYKVAL